jgi:hypothetical protein
MFQMQIYIIVVLLLSSGAVSGGLEKVLRQAKFIADISQQFPHSCTFIIVSEAQQQGENQFYIIYISCVFLLKRNELTETWDGKCLCFPIHNKEIFFEIFNFSGWEINVPWTFHIRRYCLKCCNILYFSLFTIFSLLGF